MHVLPKDSAEKRLVATASLALLVPFGVWLGIRGPAPQSARDFEECAENVQAESPSAERAALMVDCDTRFAGRRKAGGGYTYYDFMQNRHFDIVGSNPTAEERKQMDYAYIGFLDAQRREDVSGDIAKRQNDQPRADLETARQSVGPPIGLTPASTVAKRPVDRAKLKPCHDGSLSCSWARFSSVVKNAFASSSRSQLNPAVASD